MSKRKIFTMAIDDWRNKVLSDAARVFGISKSKIVHDLLSIKTMAKIEKMTKEAEGIKWKNVNFNTNIDSERPQPTREYRVLYRNFHRFLIGIPPEDMTCEECGEMRVIEIREDNKNEN